MIWSLLRNRIKRKRTLSFFKRNLKNGFLYYNGYFVSDKNNDCNIFRRLFHLFFIFSFDKNDVQKNTIVVRGTYKLCILRGGLFYTYCLDKNIYYRNKENYMIFESSFLYPHARSISFLDSEQLICVEYIDGKVYNDRKHLIAWAKAGIKIASNVTHEIREGVLYYIQHGDAHHENVYWVNEYEFKYIDLDNIGFWPALYDVILGMTVAFKSAAFDIIEKELFDDIKSLFNCIGLDYDLSVLDFYYREFVKVWAKRDLSTYSRVLEPFKFLKAEYVLTEEILKTLGIKDG